MTFQIGRREHGDGYRNILQVFGLPLRRDQDFLERILGEHRGGQPEARERGQREREALAPRGANAWTRSAISKYAHWISPRFHSAGAHCPRGAISIIEPTESYSNRV